MEATSKFRFDFKNFALGAASGIAVLAVVAVMSSNKQPHVNAATGAAVASDSAPAPALKPATSAADRPVMKLKPGDAYVTTVDALQRAYAKNEVATDKEINGRPVLMQGFVQAIEKDMFNKPVLAFRAGNRLMPARASMVDGQEAELARLVPGAQLYVLCARTSFIMQTPAGYDCRLAEVTQTN